LKGDQLRLPCESPSQKPPLNDLFVIAPRRDCTFWHHNQPALNSLANRRISSLNLDVVLNHILS
jgi:hypothetical protein